jgi:hypothetical protein
MDIVERLRRRIGLVKFDSDAIALHDAADTIEQLRGLVEVVRPCREEAYADLEKQDAEIERLRDVLQSISNNTCCDNCQEAALVARAALKEKE